MYWLMNAKAPFAKLPGICVSVFTTASLSGGLSFPAPVRMTSCLCWQSGLVQPTGNYSGSFACTVSRMHTPFVGALILAWFLFAPTNGSSSGISRLKPPYLPLPPSRPLPLPPFPPPQSPWGFHNPRFGARSFLSLNAWWKSLFRGWVVGLTTLPEVRTLASGSWCGRACCGHPAICSY